MKTDPKINKAINFSILIFLIAKVISAIFQKEGTHHFYAYNLGGLAIIFFSLRHLYQLFVNHESKINPFREISFWFSFGLFFFFTGTFIILGAYNVYEEMPIFSLYIFRIIVDFNNAILYSSFTIAFILNLRRNNY